MILCSSSERPPPATNGEAEKEKGMGGDESRVGEGRDVLKASRGWRGRGAGEEGEEERSLDCPGGFSRVKECHFSLEVRTREKSGGVERTALGSVEEDARRSPSEDYDERRRHPKAGVACAKNKEVVEGRESIDDRKKNRKKEERGEQEKEKVAYMKREIKREEKKPHHGSSTEGAREVGRGIEVWGLAEESGGLPSSSAACGEVEGQEEELDSKGAVSGSRNRRLEKRPKEKEGEEEREEEHVEEEEEEEENEETKKLPRTIQEEKEDEAEEKRERKRSHSRRGRELHNAPLSSSSSSSKENSRQGRCRPGDSATASTKNSRTCRRERSSTKHTATSEEDELDEDDEEEKERTSKLPVTADYTLISRGLVDMSHVQLEASRDPEDIPPPNVGDWIESKAAHQDAQIFRAKVVERRRCPVNLWIFRLRSPDMTSTYIEPLKHVRKDNVWSLAREMDLAGGRKARRSAGFNYLPRRGGGAPQVSHGSNSTGSNRSGGGGERGGSSCSSNLLRGNRHSASLSPRESDDRSGFRQKIEEPDHSSSFRGEGDSARLPVAQACDTASTRPDEKASCLRDLPSKCPVSSHGEEFVVRVKGSDDGEAAAASFSPVLNPSLSVSSFSSSSPLPYSYEHSSRLPPTPYKSSSTPPVSSIPVPDEGVDGHSEAENVGHRQSVPLFSDAARLTPLVYVHPHSRRRDLIMKQQLKRASAGDYPTTTAFPRVRASLLFTSTTAGDDDKENRSNNALGYFPGSLPPLGKNQQEKNGPEPDFFSSDKVHRRLSDPSALSTARPSSARTYTGAPAADHSRLHSQGCPWISLPSTDLPHYSSTGFACRSVQNTELVQPGEDELSPVSQPSRGRHLSALGLDTGKVGFTDTAFTESAQCQGDAHRCPAAKSKLQVKAAFDSAPSSRAPPGALPRRSLPAYHHLEKIFSKSKLTPLLASPGLSCTGLFRLHSQQFGDSCSGGGCTRERSSSAQTGVGISGRRGGVGYRRSDGAVVGLRGNASFVGGEAFPYGFCSTSRTEPEGSQGREVSSDVDTLGLAGRGTICAMSSGGNGDISRPTSATNKRRSSGSASRADDDSPGVQGGGRTSFTSSIMTAGEARPFVVSKRLHRQTNDLQSTMRFGSFHASEYSTAGSTDIEPVSVVCTPGEDWKMSSDGADEAPPTLLARLPAASNSRHYSKVEDRSTDTCGDRDLAKSNGGVSEGVAGGT